MIIFAKVQVLKSRRTTAHNIVQLFDILLKIEASLYYLSPEERLKQRKLQMQPIVDQLIREIEKASKDPFVPKKSKLARACNYFLTYQKQLLMFMQDGSIPLHNMVAENAIRPFAIGRKNWLFCGSPLGAQAMACLLTVIETAKANGLDPYKYLTYLFEHMRGDDWKNDPEYIRRLLPWAPEVQAACAAKKKAA